MSEPIFRISFYNQNEVYEVYARQIFQSEMYGFIEIEEFVFGERSQVVVDPTEERLKQQFTGVTRSYIPMHSVIRIDEVEKEGVGKITEAKGSNVASFPSMPFGSGNSGPNKEN
ncbi:MAG: DUF1820 family protein [Pseudomonadales bacterium]|nr:DUF1820 family protein [Pseudomonadales bacterium]